VSIFAEKSTPWTTGQRGRAAVLRGRCANGSFLVVRLRTTVEDMATPPKSEEEVKTLDRTERQVELDAIALYGNSQEFPSLSNAFVQEETARSELGSGSIKAAG
jgi:hypothetical protein